jgi:fructokinase
MKTISLDLRERILEAYDEGDGTREEVGRRFRVPARRSVLRLAAIARKKGCLVSFDPNLRLALWRSRREAREVMGKMIGLSALLRMNREEAQFLTGQAEPGRAARVLLRQGPRLVVITDGEHGSSAYSAKSSATVLGFAVTAVDTTGCGDAFLAGLLYEVLRLKDDPGRWSRETLVAVCRYANAVGALNSLKHGASAAMPTGDEVKQFLASREDG